MKGAGVKFRQIAICRDGGSVLFEFNGSIYFLDKGIGSETHGTIFHGNNRKGLPVNDELRKKISSYVS